MFKDSSSYYYIDDNNILTRDLFAYDLLDVPHLDDAEVLYYYKGIITGKIYPVYFEHNGRFITDGIFRGYDIIDTRDVTRDYTLDNLKLL